MSRTRNYVFSLAICLLTASHAQGQGTPAVLRCIFKGSVELHATLEPSSPVLARIPCGTPLVLVDHRSSSPHVRTKDGKDGYIISFNGGQWSVESGGTHESPSTAQPVTQPTAPDPDVLPAEPPATPGQEPIVLTNSDIFDLLKAGVSTDVVIALIDSSRVSFDTAPAALASLKTMSVPDPVVLAMLRARGSVSAGVSKPVNDRKHATDDLAEIFKRLQSSVVTVWSEFGHGTGFIIDEAGLILTTQHVVGPSVYIAVQFDATHKIPATLVAASAEKNIAVLWANLVGLPGATVAPVFGTTSAAMSAVEGAGVLSIGSPINQRKVMTIGTVRKVEARTIITDINLNRENSGGPLINTAGEVIGITTFPDADNVARVIPSVIRIEEAAPLIADAHALISQLPNPPALLMPVDPTDSFPIEAVKETLVSDKFDSKPYSVGMGDFEMLMITPTLKYRMQTYAIREADKTKSRENRWGSAQTFKPFERYRGWMDYFSEYKAVLHIQVTPQSKTDFYGMRVLCGEREIQPIHPGKIAHVTNSHATYEGLYSYAADAISPACGQVRIEVYAEKNQEKPTVKVLDNKLVERIAEDLAPYLKSHP